jgi:xylulokinase
MSEKYVIGVDLGTTAIKAGLFNDKGIVVSTHTQEHSLMTPAPLTVEQSAENYWEAFKISVKRVMEKSQVEKDKVLSLSISAQGETLAFFDNNMQILGNFIVWMDTRAQEEAEIINSLFSAEEILEVTGQGKIISLYPACKVLWMKRKHPEIFRKTSKIMLLEDYIFYLLTGRICGEGSLWCTSYMWNIKTKKWWPEMLELLEVREDQLPDIVETTTCLGKILPSVAEELGLSEELELVMGGLDQLCGAIGVGNVEPGIFSESTGALVAVCTMSDGIVLDPGGEIPCFFGAIPGQYMLHAGAKGGIIYRWLRDVLCTEELAIQERGGPDAYDLMDAQASKIPAGSEGLVVLPFFGGAGAPETDQYAKGMIYGLGLQHSKPHIIRAFLEAVAINIYRMVQYSEKITGKEIKEIRSLGGGANSALWCQIKADVLGRPVVTMKNVQDAACLGAAIIAGVGAKLWPSISQIASEVTEIDKVYLPNDDNRAAYDELADKYALLVDSIKANTAKL